NPVADGTQAIFRATLGRLSASAVESRQGRAQSRLLADGKVGQAEVSVKVGQESAQEQVAFLPGPPHSLSLSAVPAEVEVGGDVQVRATVVDAWGNPVADGTTVGFYSSRGSMPSQGQTSGGEAVASLSAGTVAGEAQVSARVAGISGSMAVRFLPGPPSTVSLLVNPLSVDAGGEVELTVEARDALGNPVADGTPVFFGTTLGSLSAGSVESKQGRAQSRLLADGKVGQADVSVKVGQESAQEQVAFLPGPPQSLSLSAVPTEVEVGGDVQVRATVVDAWGNPVADGTVVGFYSSRGSMPSQGQTTGGEAVASLSAGIVAGEAQVSARVAGIAGSVAVRFLPGPPSTVSVLVNPLSVDAGGEVELTVEARDALGNPVADGTPVFFGTTLGSLSAGSVESKQGRAQSRLLADGKVGQADVSVKVGQESAQEQVAFLPGSPHSLSLTADLAEVEVGGDVQIRATVVDAWGNPVADDTPVAFQTTRGFVSSGLSRALAGEATAFLAVGTDPGYLKVTATAMKANGTIELYVRPGPPALLNLTAPVASILVGRTTELLVLVQDALGNPVADGTEVVFNATQGQVWPPVTHTKSGQAQVDLVAPDQQGQVRVSASSGRAQHAIAVDIVSEPPNTTA
ncbi:MAG: invasin domain 3-containing protein, partial [Anaerolineae bacterium]|nr:invasin domain 3-containing protein [Anaerolineae bacterium]